MEENLAEIAASFREEIALEESGNASGANSSVGQGSAISPVKVSLGQDAAARWAEGLLAPGRSSSPSLRLLLSPPALVPPKPTMMAEEGRIDVT